MRMVSFIDKCIWEIEVDWKVLIHREGDTRPNLVGWVGLVESVIRRFGESETPGHNDTEQTVTIRVNYEKMAVVRDKGDSEIITARRGLLRFMEFTILF